MNSRELHINDLPSEVLQLIFGFLPHLEDRKTLSLVCRRWNDLAFDYSFLGQIKLKLFIRYVDRIPRQIHGRSEAESINKQYKILRYYRTVDIRYWSVLNFRENEIEKVLTWFEKPTSSLEELVCEDSSRNFPTLKLLSMCRNVRKVRINTDRHFPDENLPVLEHLEELFLNTQRMNIIHVAPNLRTLRVDKYHKLKGFSGYIDPFQKCTEVTKLTFVDLFWCCIDQNGLEQLCKFCPLLTKLRITVTMVTSLLCLANLAHLKVLSLYSVTNKLFENNDVCLPNVEIVELDVKENLLFDKSMQRMLPDVHYLKYGHVISITGKIDDGFPRLKTLEIWGGGGAAHLIDTLVGLSNLRELIVRNLHLSDSRLPPLDLLQLTLQHSKLKVTDEMAKNCPSLQFLNLVGPYSQCISTEKLPSGCTVRRYPSINSWDIFDIQ